MGIAAKIRNFVGTVRNAVSTARKPADWFIEWIRPNKRVTAETAITLPEIWYAISRIGGNVGTLPLQIFERNGDQQKSKARTHAAYQLHKRRPNPLMSAAVFRETVMVHALLRGNGRAWIERSGNGKPLAMHILPADTLTVIVNGAKWHVAKLTDEKGAAKEYKIHDRDVLHIVGLSFDGITGIDLIKAANDSIGFGIANLRSGKRTFENQGLPGLILTDTAGTFKTDAEAKEFLERFNEMHQGLDNKGKTALLRRGVTATPIEATSKDMESVENRRVSRQDAALWFLLESIIGDDTSVSYNSLEQKNLAYLSNCLARWLVRWEQECDEKLLTEREKREESHFHRFNVEALLRTDSKSKAETISKLIVSRVLNPNEARDLYDWDRYDGGDEYANPAITPGQSADSNEADTTPTGGNA